MSYTHLTPIERGQIQALNSEKKSLSYIAEILGRHKSTISRELQRNRAPKGYDAQRAQKQYKKRREDCRPKKKLAHRALWGHVIDKISDGITPEGIAGRLPLEYPGEPRMRISHECIYQTIYNDKRLRFLIPHLPQARPKRRKRGQGKTRRGPSIPNRIGIEQRPEVVEQRIRFGDWEGDLIVGANQQGYILTLVDRTSRFLLSAKLETKHARETALAVIHALEDMPTSWVKTITFDNGTEFAHHEEMSKVLPVNIYFADPYSSYQRGTNENTNGLIRRYLPKKSSFRNLTKERLDQITKELNDRPRKCLGCRTPNEVFKKQRQEHRVALRA